MNTIEKVLYSVSAKAVGGREGQVNAIDPVLNLKLAKPKALGGRGGEGTNPEQLFAAGYAACFTSAVELMAAKEKVTLPHPTEIEGHVGIGAITQGFGIEVELKISLPGIDKTVAHNLIEKAHQVCPYSNATRGNIQVTLTLL